MTSLPTEGADRIGADERPGVHAWEVAKHRNGRCGKAHRSPHPPVMARASIAEYSRVGLGGLGGLGGGSLFPVLLLG